MYFAETNISFTAVGRLCEGKLSLERSSTEVSLVAWETPGELVALQVESVRNAGTLEELATDLWSFEPVDPQGGDGRYRLICDGPLFSGRLGNAKWADQDPLHQNFLFGGKVEITVNDGHERATHLFVDLGYNQGAEG